ncbi:MAG: hypothetical protein KY453_06520 [Gemmatimonadetes bacterium]|nr:hypothetical protein [Gemmatimonadota bacterium]
MRPARALVCALAVLAAGGCAAGPAATATPPGVASQPPAIHWVRSSAEHRVLFLQVYGQAAEAVREREGAYDDGRWAVILDADETVLDNSEYQRRRAAAGLGFTLESWNDWVREEAAPALPGAVRFVERVRSLGGRVAIVTNRDEPVCDATRRNLDALGIVADVVLCRQAGEEGKDGRFRAVQEGTTHAALPPLEVLAWVGDNIQDFPGMGQEAREAPADALARFGRSWFLLPNPMYGSWERLPPRE